MTMGPSTERSELFESTFNFYRRIFILPFKLETDSETGTYILKSDCIQKGVCILLHITAVSSQGYYVISLGLEYINGGGAVLYSSVISQLCNLISSIASCLLMLIFIVTLWLGRGKILTLLELLRGGQNRKQKKLLLALMLVGCLFHVWRNLDLARILPRLGHPCPGSGKDYPPQNKSDSDSNWEDMTMSFLKGMKPFSDVIVNCIFLAIHVSLVALALSLGGLGRAFVDGLEATKAEVNKGVAAYLLLKEKMAGINQVMSPLLLLYFFMITAYLVRGPDILTGFETEDAIYLYLVLIISFWTISAESHYRIRDGLQSWLHHQIFENPTSVNFSSRINLRIGSIKSEVESGLEGLALSTKYFAVTNSFLSTILGLIITYSIIIFQMQPPKSN